MHSVVAGIGKKGGGELLLAIWKAGHRMRNAARIGAILCVALIALGIGLAADRMRAVARGGVLLIAGSILLAAILPLGRFGIASMVSDPLVRGALQGLWRTYLGELLGWGLFLGGLGILFTAAATSLLETLRPKSIFAPGCAPSSRHRPGGSPGPAGGWASSPSGSRPSSSPRKSSPRRPS